MSSVLLEKGGRSANFSPKSFQHGCPGLLVAHVFCWWRAERWLWGPTLMDTVRFEAASVCRSDLAFPYGSRWFPAAEGQQQSPVLGPGVDKHV